MKISLIKSGNFVFAYTSYELSKNRISSNSREKPKNNKFFSIQSFIRQSRKSFQVWIGLLRRKIAEEILKKVFSLKFSFPKNAWNWDIFQKFQLAVI